LSGETLFTEDALFLAKILKLGQYPAALRFKLARGEMRYRRVDALSQALLNCPQFFFLDLRQNNIKVRQVKPIARALETGNFPQGLKISLAQNPIRSKGAKLLAQALEKGRFPALLSINLADNGIGKKGISALAQALAKGQFSGRISINLSHNQIGKKGAKALANALENGDFPGGISLNLANNSIGKEGSLFIAGALAKGHFPHGIAIDLSENRIGKKGAQYLALSLEKGRFPQGISLNLAYNHISRKGLQALADALALGHFLGGVSINLTGISIGNEGAKLFAQALIKGNFPQGVSLNMADSHIGHKGARALADVLQRAHGLEHLSLGLRGNQFGTAGVSVLMRALAVGHCGSNLTLDLSGNTSSYPTIPRGVLQHGPYHQRFINLLGEPAVKELSEVLISGHCPQRLTVILEESSIQPAVSRMLAQALACGTGPVGLQLFGKFNDDKVKIYNALKKLSYDDQIYLCLILQLGRYDKKSKLFNLPSGPLGHIYTFLLLPICKEGRFIEKEQRETQLITHINSLWINLQRTQLDRQKKIKTTSGIEKLISRVGGACFPGAVFKDKLLRV